MLGLQPDGDQWRDVIWLAGSRRFGGPMATLDKSLNLDMIFKTIYVMLKVTPLLQGVVPKIHPSMPGLNCPSWRRATTHSARWCTRPSFGQFLDYRPGMLLLIVFLLWDIRKTSEIYFCDKLDNFEMISKIVCLDKEPQRALYANVHALPAPIPLLTARVR